MSNLKTKPNLGDPDGIYQMLIDLHAGRDEHDSMKVNAKLILALANHIGDQQVIAEAIAIAGAGAQE
ncbi:DUF2783 domain-containing protein [Parasphingorhabdus cellanae]|uniref:DUF2783 domain-containing protein n=1 Tax=Parasphingorhabdus cellanae TaxID=2806553 RepID=A0ABX7T4X0_9SPHN|nr:DUF2783 domain-containing protein [Parasphingorhabdus cellanae]QTD55850.1 DUF2783 domain-containing protein [Parasphingorhabdus cellanae]